MISPPLDDAFSLTYEELRRLAATVRRNESSVTLNPTALVNEAYIKLSETLRMTPESRLHFKRIAARAMRQVLIEAARRRNALKRGGDLDFVTFDEALERSLAHSKDLLALHDALEKLETMSPRQAQLIEYRFFGGYDVAETAELLGVSESTVQRDWRSARAWLAIELRAGG